MKRPGDRAGMRTSGINRSKVFLNGRIVRHDEAAVPVADTGFLYGLGVFETLKVEDSIPLFLQEHLRRLMKGLRVLAGARPPWDPARAVERVITANSLVNGALRITVTPGPPGGVPTLVVAPREIQRPIRPIRLGLSPFCKSATDPFAGVKTTS